MAESGNVDVVAAFNDTEKWRIQTEAKHALDFYSLEERRTFLAAVERWRGEVGRKQLEAAILAEWNKRKAA